MLNILGEDILKFRNSKIEKNKFFFDYEKKEIRPKRKMGHINIIEQLFYTLLYVHQNH